MATGITLEDLQATMQKAGIPMNTMAADPTYKKHSQLMTASRGQIPGAFAMPNADKYKQDYMAKIAKIAEMDQKLAGVYGNPSGKLFIEHAGQREGAIYGARPVTEAQTQEPINAYNAELDQRDQNIEAAKSFYDQLIESQQNAEKLQTGSPLTSLDFDDMIDQLETSGTMDGGINLDDLLNSIENGDLTLEE